MKCFLLIGNLGMGELLVISLVFILLFGGQRIPEVMRGLGKAYKSFKQGVSTIEKEIDDIDPTKMIK